MHRYLLVAAFGAGALAAAPADPPAPSASDGDVHVSARQEPFRWSGRVAVGKTIEVKGVKGTIRAVPASGSEVEVVATRRAERGDPQSVRIEVVPHEGGVTVCAVYPRGSREWDGDRRREGERAGESGYNRCDPGEWRNLNVQGNDVSVDFTVRVPAGVRLAARNVSGDVDAEGMRGYVDARSVSGDVRISTTGFGEASSVSGEIVAVLGSGGWSGDLDFRTVSGDITLELPARASTEVWVETMSGEIRSDFPLDVEQRPVRRPVRRRARGTIGEGGRELYLTTYSGDVRLRRSR
jgi:hypothetical protein